MPIEGPDPHDIRRNLNAVLDSLKETAAARPGDVRVLMMLEHVGAALALLDVPQRSDA